MLVYKNLKIASFYGESDIIHSVENPTLKNLQEHFDFLIDVEKNKTIYKQKKLSLNLDELELYEKLLRHPKQKIKLQNNSESSDVLDKIAKKLMKINYQWYVKGLEAKYALELEYGKSSCATIEKVLTETEYFTEENIEQFKSKLFLAEGNSIVFQVDNERVCVLLYPDAPSQKLNLTHFTEGSKLKISLENDAKIKKIILELLPTETNIYTSIFNGKGSIPALSKFVKTSTGKTTEKKRTIHSHVSAINKKFNNHFGVSAFLPCKNDNYKYNHYDIFVSYR